jgi:hypothetical protein
MVTIDVQGAELAISLNVSGTPFGADAGTSWAGAAFWVNAYVQDLRDAAQGVVGGAIDLLFDADFVVSTGLVAYGQDFSAFQQGEPNNVDGLIDETGALTTASSVGAADSAPFVAWQFTRVGGEQQPLADAQAQFAVDPGEGVAMISPANFALVGSGEPANWDSVELGTVDLDLVFGDFNGDQSVNHFDLALWQPTSGAVVGDPNYDLEYDLNSDGQIDQSDLDLLMANMYRPGPPDPASLQELTASDPLAPRLSEASLLDDRLSSPAEVRDSSRLEKRLRAVDSVFGRDRLWLGARSAGLCAWRA